MITDCHSSKHRAVCFEACCKHPHWRKPNLKEQTTTDIEERSHSLSMRHKCLPVCIPLPVKYATKKTEDLSGSFLRVADSPPKLSLTVCLAFSLISQCWWSTAKPSLYREGFLSKNSLWAFTGIKNDAIIFLAWSAKTLLSAPRLNICFTAKNKQTKIFYFQSSVFAEACHKS